MFISSRQSCMAVTIAPGIGALVSASMTTPSIGPSRLDHDGRAGAVVGRVLQVGLVEVPALDLVHPCA